MRLAIAFLLATTGCLTATGDRFPTNPDQPDDPDHPDDPEDPPPPPPAPVATGAYQVRSSFEITIEALLPEPAARYVATLRDFSSNPARTLISLADDAGVPAVGTLFDYMPSALETRIEGWINDEIAKAKIAGMPVTTVAGNIAALAETSLTQVAVEGELTITGGTATHRLTTLDLSPTGIDTQLALGAFPSDVVTATCTATSSQGTLVLGEHGFAFAYGEYAWQAVDAAFATEYGAGIRATLGAAVNCPVVAARVAAKCVWGVCVSHAAELTELCERGLDEVVDRAHAKFSAYRFDAIQLTAGTATLVDTTGDAIAERLEAGVWTAEINAGQGLRHVPATFTATR